jgi:ubiquinone/menaquinone biosynthesis C-methylase UbiE
MDNMYEHPELIDEYTKGMVRDDLDTFQKGLGNRSNFLYSYIVNKATQFSTVLDVGCATANLSKTLATLRGDLHYVGVDVSMPMLRRAREMHGPRINLAIADLMNPPFRENSIPYVVCAGTINYFENGLAALEAIYRIASRALITELLYMPKSDEQVASIQFSKSYKQPVYFFGQQQLQHTLLQLHLVHPFENLKEQNRYKTLPLNKQPSGFHELAEDQNVFSIMLILEKTVSAPLI